MVFVVDCECCFMVFLFKQKTAYEMRISDWSSDVCSSDLLRDLVQRRLGRTWALGAIVVGAMLSGAVAPPPLVFASATAFFFSELADFGVYTPLQERRFIPAVVVSSIVGLFVASVLFLWLAFGRPE